MTKYEKAAQIMPMLRLAARNRQTLTYADVAIAVGGLPVGLGQWLGPIAYYCDLEGLPPLTVLVVQEATGKPGDGYIHPHHRVAKDREAVYDYNWMPHWSGSTDITWAGRLAPTPAELKQAERDWKGRHKAS